MSADAIHREITTVGPRQAAVICYNTGPLKCSVTATVIRKDHHPCFFMLGFFMLAPNRLLRS
jgi:hypothetical protein